MRLDVVCLLLLAAVACKKDDSPPDRTTPVETKAPRGPIDDAPLFDPDHLVEVELELAAADWEALRTQTRDAFELLSGDCLAEPFDSPFTYFPATLAIDGEVVSEVGTRKKGLLGSMSYTKPSLKLKTDVYVDEQLLEDGTERITLNNNVQDPSLVNQCLGYGVFAAAGLPAPRCNFATVAVNGEELGVYTHVEAVKKDFLRRHFSDDDGDLYEGALSDFHPEWSATFTAKTGDTDVDLAVVHDLTAALQVPDDQLLDAVGAIVDLPTFYRFWAAEALVGHWDGYAQNQNNFYIYRNPDTDQITFVPWGADSLFVDPNTPAVFLTGWLPARLWAVPEARQAYVAAMEDLLATAWDEAALNAEIDRMEALIIPHASDPTSASAAMDSVRSYVGQRRASIEAQLATIEVTPAPTTPRDPVCFIDEGFVTATFATEYDTLEADPFVFATTLSADSVPTDLILGSVAGPGDYGELIVAPIGVTQDFARLYQLAVILPPGLGPGTYPLDLGFATSYLVTVDLNDPYDEGDVLGVVFGEITFTELAETPGAPVVGSLSGQVVGGIF